MITNIMNKSYLPYKMKPSPNRTFIREKADADKGVIHLNTI